MVQEPYVHDNKLQGPPSTWNTLLSRSKKAALLTTKTLHKTTTIAIKENTVAIKVQTEQFPVTIISAYSSPYDNIQDTLQEIQEIITSLAGEKIVIGADLNGHNTLWGYRDNDTRGNDVFDFLLANSLYLLNSQDAPPTYHHNDAKGWPDLTMCTQEMIQDMGDWEVQEDPSSSDHSYIKTTISTPINHQVLKRYKTKYGNYAKLTKHLSTSIAPAIEELQAVSNQTELNTATTNLQTVIIKACDRTFKTKKQKNESNPVWYRTEHDILRKRLLAIKRRSQRATDNTRIAAHLHYKKERAKYINKIRKDKINGWKGFCTNAANPFGRHYKAAFRKAILSSQLVALANKTPKGSQLEAATNILEQLFPDPTPQQAHAHTFNTIDDLPFTEAEIAEVIKNTPRGKAPGYDGIDNIIVQTIHKKFPDLFTTLFNKCLQLGLYPDPFKVGNIVLFQKPGKDIHEPSAYRPIALLPSIAKVLEKLMTQRLIYHLEGNNLLSNNQYGFRAGRSVDTALDSLTTQIADYKRRYKHVRALSIDIKGAFDNVQYDSIANYLEESNCPRNIAHLFISLLQNRQVMMSTNEGPVLKQQNQGCPQGSCSGPALWNLVANDILAQHWPQHTKIQAYADDFVLVVGADTKTSLEKQTEEAIKQFEVWTSKNKLQISIEKSSYILFSNLVARTRIKWNNTTIKRQKSIKYLGVYIDEKMNWSTHIHHQTKKAAQYLQNLQKIAGKTWGINLKHRRILYKTVIERMLAHGATVWCQNPTMKLAKKLAKMQRGFLLAISGAYRTSPTAALQVALGIAPLHLQFQMESQYVSITRLRKPLSPNILNISPTQIEDKVTGWTTHPSRFPQTHQITIEDGSPITSDYNIFTDGSKTNTGVGAAFCAYEGTQRVKEWSTKLQSHNTVYQAELTAAYEAAKHATEKDNNTKIAIHIDNQASIIASANPRTPNSIARNINAILIQHPNIQLTWIKAHVGYEGNEYADSLAKQATESNDNTQIIDIPKSHIKNLLKNSMLQAWQTEWTEGTTGRIVHDVIPEVKQRLTQWRREDYIFFTGHGPFGQFRKRFRLLQTPNCACGMYGSPLHYVTECVLTSSWHLKKPAPQFQKQWYKQVAANAQSRHRIHQIIGHIHNNSELFAPV
ncbi:Putative protein in type-1 retrotransposable element R1DM [Araneus ventricosus]|uniref:Retrovirus-related Pol polyprotein from type-1 retrotransposable element R1 n=2 Tax=Araneus ventricosus TaxID=182803 RepID=A0A4Y2T746_ARAVE|nr:Putative protein in type-1 retrotransposable element R1DM [Araneus ventricosus]